VELLTTKFYNLHLVGVEKFYEESVCHKVEGVQLRFVQIQHLQAIHRIGIPYIYILPSVIPPPQKQAIRPTLPKILLAAL